MSAEEMPGLSPKAVVQAKKEIKYILSLFNGLGEVLEAVGEDGKIARALELRVEALKSEEAALEGKLQAANADASQRVQSAEVRAADILTQAEVVREQAIAANRDAEKALADAREQAAQIVAQGERDAKAAVAAVQDQIDDLRGKAREATEELTALRNDIGNAKTQQSELQSALASLKQRFG